VVTTHGLASARIGMATGVSEHLLALVTPTSSRPISFSSMITRTTVTS
jgi:hypothetical protein